jgi:CRP-like cAMP-binding protein
MLKSPVKEDIVDHNLGLRSDARAKGLCCRGREISLLLSQLPTRPATDLFATATRVKLAANQVLFLAGDPGDSCYRVEGGLLKVTMVSRSGIERILSFISRGGIVGDPRWLAAFGIGRCRARCGIEPT